MSDEIPPRDPYGKGNDVDVLVRCWRCDRLLAETLSRPWRIRCPRCKAPNAA